MGYVFTLEEFEKGRIPDAQGYRTAEVLIRNGLKNLFGRGLIYGANIHGSSLHSDGGIGSDIDVLVISYGAEEGLRLLNNQIRQNTFVPVEFVTVPISLAESGLHNLDYLYSNYIQKHCAGGIISRDPFLVVKPSPGWRNISQGVLQKLASQLFKFSKERSRLPHDFGPQHCDLLEKILRQPIYSAIDLLRIVRKGEFPNEGARTLSKRECCELYSKEFPQGPTCELNRVLELREEYRRSLQIPRIGQTHYRDLLQKIDDSYPLAKSVIERNFDILLKRKA